MDKKFLRAHFSHLRDELPPSRREEAKSKLYELFNNRPEKRILSFVSFRSEIDTSEINQLLAVQGTLALPRCNEETLDIYAVADLNHQLTVGFLGIKEPEPSRSRKISISDVDLILVPGLAYDDENFRLGYGKGLYDSLLKDSNVRTIGIGFLEQRSRVLLPRDSWDVPLTEILLI